MRRREFVTLMGGAAAVWPLAARAQQPDGMRRIAVLMSAPETDSEYQSYMSNFRAELRKFGWEDGRNLRIDYRWGALKPETRQQFATELVEIHPDLILSITTPATAAALKQTRSIPIVFVGVSDPVSSGFVTNFPRPGGNVTGFLTMEPTIAGKWLGLLKEIAPLTGKAALLFNPATAPFFPSFLEPAQVAAQTLGVEVVAAPVRDISELESVIAALGREPNGSFMTVPDTFLNNYRIEVTSLALRHRLPAVYPWRYFPEVGGLIHYGPELVDPYRRAAEYVHRILNGEKPGDLPVQAPTKYEMSINLKTAKALGLEVPPSLLARADEVIE